MYILKSFVIKKEIDFTYNNKHEKEYFAIKLIIDSIK